MDNYIYIIKNYKLYRSILASVIVCSACRFDNLMDTKLTGQF